MYNRTKSVTVTTVSIVLNWICYYHISKYFGVESPVFCATGLIVSLFVHELGHSLVLETKGIKTNMFFVLIGAGVTPGKGFENKYHALNGKSRALLALAGAMGNSAIILTCLILSKVDLLDRFSALRMINLNAGLILWNLLPIGIFDGGRFMLTYFESIRENEEKRYVRALTFLSVSSILAISIASGKMVFLPTLLLVHGINKKAKQDDPAKYYNKNRLSASDRFLWVSIWLVLLLLGTAINLVTPGFK